MSLRFLIMILAILGGFTMTTTDVAATTSTSADALPSWRNREAKQSLLKFASDVTKEGGDKFVAPEDRVAVFDNDGTLWTEQPVYSQVYFLFDRVKALAPQHPEWKNEQPFKAILERDLKTLSSLSEPDAAKLVAETHAGMTESEFESEVSDFLKTFNHPQKKVPLTELAYQPMIELIRFLQKNDFKVFIVTGGGVEFVRSFSEKVYGVPKENVIGSNLQYEYKGGEKPEILRKPELVPPVDDKTGKPVHIQREIGRTPILAFGNSDGDFEMLNYSTASSPRPRLGLILHHDDAAREYNYDRESKVGHLEKALDAATKQGWVVVSMKDDFKRVF